jgi:hypothetical protein
MGVFFGIELRFDDRLERRLIEIQFDHLGEFIIFDVDLDLIIIVHVAPEFFPDSSRLVF